MTTVTMQAPVTFGGVVENTPSGTTYGIPESGIVSVQLEDVATFLALGFQAVGPTGNVGTAAAGVTAVEFGDAYDHTTILTVDTALGAIAGGAALGLGVLLYTLPAGAQIISAAHIDLAIQQTEGHITADTPTVGLGTTVASGAVSVLSGTAAFQNILTGTAAADCDGTPTIKTTLATASPFGLVCEASGGLNKTVYFNVADTWAASGDAGPGVTGTVVLKWQQMSSI